MHRRWFHPVSNLDNFFVQFVGARGAQLTSIRGDTMVNGKFRRSPAGDQNTNLDDVGAKKIRVENKLKKIQSHTHNQQQTSILSQLDVMQIHHPLFDQCTFPGLSKVESSGHTAYINGQMERNAPKIQPQVHSLNVQGIGVIFWNCGGLDLAITSRILKSITLNSIFWWKFLG